MTSRRGAPGSLTLSTVVDSQRRIVMEAIEGLPPQCQAALTLKVFQGLSYREIGIKLGITTESVERHIAHGLLQVHAYISSHPPPTMQ